MSSEWIVPLSDIDVDATEEAAVLRVLRSRWLSMGPEVDAFETEFAQLVECPHAIAVASGTAALHLALSTVGVAPGDEVIQPAINFVAAANMTVALGATPVFADLISMHEPTIDPADVRRLIGPKTKAVVAMHYGGYCCRMADIIEVCRKSNVAVIEDACHAVGARFLGDSRPPAGRMAGNLGDVACFSFFGNKNLVTGEGGMVTTNRDDLAKSIRLLRSHGMTTLTWDRHRGHASSYDVVRHGQNARMDELRAALGRTQLAKLVANNKRRALLVERYRQIIGSASDWIVPFADYAGDSAHHLMVVVAPDADRRRARGALKDAGIQTSLHYPLIPGFTAFAKYDAGELPISRSFAERALTLPVFPGMTMEQIELVCGKLLTS